MEIEDALARFQTQLDADGRSPHTRRQYQRHVRLLSRWLRDTGRSTGVRDLTHETVASFLAAHVARTRPDGKPKKATTTNALRTSLGVFLRHCHDAGYAPTNAGRLIRRARCAPPPPRGLSRDEQARLLDVLSKATGEEADRDRVLFEVLLATGIRVGSALALDVGDVDLERGELLLRSMKNSSSMCVYFNKRVGALLRGLIADRTDAPLFESRHRRRLSARQVARRLAFWCREARIQRPTCCHGLRHSFATDLYRRTGDVLLVREALGHASLASTAIYVRTDPERLRRAIV